VWDKMRPHLVLTFKDAKQFYSLQHSTLAQARAQDVADILDPIYIPSTLADKDLFSEKQKYMFAVFERTLLTNVGKSIVCDHEDDGDAQEVYKAVVDYYVKSTKASLDSAGLLSYITSICLGSDLWKGSTHALSCTGKIKYTCMRNRSLQWNIFLLTKSVSCFRMQCTL